MMRKENMFVGGCWRDDYWASTKEFRECFEFHVFCYVRYVLSELDLFWCESQLNVRMYLCSFVPRKWTQRSWIRFPRSKWPVLYWSSLSMSRSFFFRVRHSFLFLSLSLLPPIFLSLCFLSSFCTIYLQDDCVLPSFVFETRIFFMMKTCCMFLLSVLSVDAVWIMSC